MTTKRFVDGGAEAIEEQFLIDTLTNNNYWIDNGLDEIIDMLNQLSDENEQLKKELKDLQIKFRKFNNQMIGEMK